MAEQCIPIPNDALPEFDELYSISDLHLGGLPRFQIFDSGKQLVWLIENLISIDSSRRVALVINGDFVDFLAEEPTRHFDPLHAVQKLDRIVEDPAFCGIWRALRKYVKTPQRTLFINLGNHDLELALPWVRHRLLEILAEENLEARGRIVFSFDGAGVLCRVGSARVLCVHGNEVDTWNIADYERLRRIGRDVVQGIPVADWQPNAGSKMVIEVMNDLKRNFPFIDLLKPETIGLIPTLVALVPDKKSKLDDLVRVASRLGADRLRRNFGFLSGEEDDATLSAVPARPVRRDRLEKELDQLRADLLRETENRIDENLHPLDLIDFDERDQTLGLVSATRKLFKGERSAEVLREALEKLQHDQSFQFSFADKDTFEPLDKQISGSIDFLIAGHTHLERALRRTRGGYYFNSGTWARLIQFEKGLLQDAEGFEDVFELLKKADMKQLDDFEYKIGDEVKKLVIRRLTVVAVCTEGEKVRGQLRHVNTSSPGQHSLDPVEQATFEK